MEQIKQQFLEAYSLITRSGAGAMLEWLEHETDFFTAPAASRHHAAYPGGLMTHSLNVYRRLGAIAFREGHNGARSAEVRETVAILGLLHDVCKADVYHQETKRRKNPETGQWEDQQVYTFRDPFPLGHGEKSLYLVRSFISLTDEEALAIRWHMGAFDEAVKGGSRALNAAMDVSPWVWMLHEADMCATHMDEKPRDFG